MTAARMTEADLQRWLIEAAGWHGWRVFHPKPARLPNGKIVTAYDGDKGFPDTVLARRGVVLFAELKLDGKYPEPEQRAWRDAIGSQWRLWRPSDRDEIERTLRTGAR